MPCTDSNRRNERGFTLVEALITVAILGIIVLIGVPTFLGTLTRTRLTGSSRQIATLFQVARLEAIKRNAFVKVAYDSTLRRFYAFVDDNRDGNEDTGERRMPDTVDLPRRVVFRGPGESAPDGPDSIDNWDTATGVVPPFGPVFRFDGSAVLPGAFRVADSGPNILEVRVENAATGRVVLKKWDSTASRFYASGENNTQWKWY
jgi:prepilin-type N-terminal cleavage/methylation domain-containing protein